MSQFVVPAVTITGVAEKALAIDAFNGTPFVLGLVQQGQVEMDIGENLDWIGHAIIDAEMRRLCGLPARLGSENSVLHLHARKTRRTPGSRPSCLRDMATPMSKGYADLWKLQ